MVCSSHYEQFIETIIEKGLPDLISFDHDLDEEHYNQPVDYENYKEKTGYDCAKWLIEHCMKLGKPLPEWRVHSFNPVGRANINMILSTYRDKEEICE